MNPIITETLANFDFNLYEPIMNRSLDPETPLLPKAGNIVKVISGMRHRHEPSLVLGNEASGQ